MSSHRLWGRSLGTPGGASGGWAWTEPQAAGRTRVLVGCHRRASVSCGLLGGCPQATFGCVGPSRMAAPFIKASKGHSLLEKWALQTSAKSPEADLPERLLESIDYTQVTGQPPLKGKGGPQEALESGRQGLLSGPWRLTSLLPEDAVFLPRRLGLCSLYGICSKFSSYMVGGGWGCPPRLTQHLCRRGRCYGGRGTRQVASGSEDSQTCGSVAASRGALQPGCLGSGTEFHPGDYGAWRRAS